MLYRVRSTIWWHKRVCHQLLLLESVSEAAEQSGEGLVELASSKVYKGRKGAPGREEARTAHDTFQQLQQLLIETEGVYLGGTWKVSGD